MTMRGTPKAMSANPDRSAGRTAGPLRGSALAADALSAVVLMAAAGAVYVWGFDGLAYGLGLGAGLVLLQLALLPGLAASGARSVPEFFHARYASRGVGLTASAAVAVSMAPLLIAQLMAAGLAASLLFGIGASAGIAIAGLGLIACFVLRPVTGAVWAGAIVFALMLVAVLVPTIELSTEWYGLPVPQLAYGNALWKAQTLEETLLFDDLADPTYMRTLIRPYLTLSLTNFLGLLLGIAAGTAGLAHVLSRHVMDAPARTARWGAVWGLGFAGLLLTATAAVAAYVKVALLTLVAGRVEIANLPEWVFAYGRIGLIEVCGRPATDLGSVTSACAELPDASPVLRLQDLTISPDAVLLALPDIAGLGTMMAGLVVAMVLVIAIVTAVGPLNAIAGALSGARAERPGLMIVIIAAAVVAAAALAAAARPSDVLTLTTWAFVLAGAGLLPALLAASWWCRASGAGLIAGMIAGLTVGLFYLIATRFFAVPFYETWTQLSSAGPMAREFFAEYKEAWMSAEPGAAKDAAWLVFDAHAQTMANWWGIRPVATALLALPAGLVALVVVSLLTPRRERG